MRNALFLLSAFTVAATLSLGACDADAAPKKSKKAKSSKVVIGQVKHEPKSVWGWKNAKLTAEFIKSYDGSYTTHILPDAKNADELVPIASLTKLMTAQLVFEAIDAGKLSPNQMIDVSRASLLLPDNSYAVKGLPKGIKEISVSNALTHNLKLSSNTMAVNLAVATAGSVEAFVEQMNAKAQQWGMKNTRFKNPHGLPQGDRKDEHTTANDMLIMAQHMTPQFERFKEHFYMPLKPWTLKETKFANKEALAEFGAVAKTGTIDGCASLWTLTKAGENLLVNIELCTTRKTRYDYTLAALKNGFSRLADMVIPSAMAFTLPDLAKPTTPLLPFLNELPKPVASSIPNSINVSSRQVQPLDP